MSTLQNTSNSPDGLGMEVATRSSTLLKTVARVVDSLCLQQQLLETCSAVARDAIGRIGASRHSMPIDCKGTVDKTLIEAQRCIEKLRDALTKEHHSAIAVAAGLQSNLNALRLAIVEHDSDYPETLEEFKSMEEMIAFMRHYSVPSTPPRKRCRGKSPT